MQIRLTGPALADLTAIEEYTRQTWGEHQADVYLAQLESRMKSLLETPYLGVTRPDIAEGYRCLPEGKHLIFYRIEDVISILGVPHASMDLESNLEFQREEELRRERER